MFYIIYFLLFTSVHCHHPRAYSCRQDSCHLDQLLTLDTCDEGEETVGGGSGDRETYHIYGTVEGIFS